MCDCRSAIGLLTLGKSDFEAIEAFRRDRFFQEALGIGQVPGSVWLRQQLETHASVLREHTDDWSVRLIRRSGAPITAENGFTCLDFDTFVMDNSGTKKEWVGRTYQGVDGYTPIAAVRELVALTQSVLSRSDSGFDSARLLFQQDDEKRSWATEGRIFEYLVKWNPRKQDLAAWVERAEAVHAFQETRPGKRTIDRRGQHLLVPELSLEGWWTSLQETPLQVIDRYAKHGTHEQFHSEIKTDLDLERLPSGKFDCNDLILHLGMFAYNCLRLIGQLGLTGEPG